MKYSVAKIREALVQKKEAIEVAWDNTDQEKKFVEWKVKEMKRLNDQLIALRNAPFDAYSYVTGSDGQQYYYSGSKPIKFARPDTSKIDAAIKELDMVIGDEINVAPSNNILKLAL